MSLRIWTILGAALVIAACSDNRGSDARIQSVAVPGDQELAQGQEHLSSSTATSSQAAIKVPAALVATAATQRANRLVAERLPISDQSDFEDARRGFLAAIEDGRIYADDGRVVWDQSAFSFLENDAPPTANPSLWRQAQLNHIHGLFEVTDGLYQVRGYDLAVMTVIRGETGWILIDPLLTKETAAAALQLVNDTLGERPVTGVLFTHGHADHFGGARGVLSEEQIREGSVRIIAPEGFEEEVIAENVIAGPAMSRRAQFQFGSYIDASAVGKIDSGIGTALSTGRIGFVPPTEVISETGQSLIVDGIEFLFVDASGTEAPSEFMFYLPQFRAMHTAEVAVATMHNVLTLRGASVRDPLLWSKKIDEVIRRYGDQADTAIASHNWPTWGNGEVLEYLRNQRDAYRWIHDQTIRLANRGETMHEIADQIGEPPFMATDFATRGYYGTLNHNSKATYQRYFGWWDGNPANLNPHPPEDQARRMVRLAGGSDAMIAQAADAFDEGDYRWVATIMNHLVFAEPENETAKGFLAAAYEQLGFQSESSIWRNYYLAAAHELRHGLPSRDLVNLVNPDFVRAVPTGDYFDVLASQVNPARAGDGHALDFTFTDTGEEMSVFISNAVAAHDKSGHAPKPDHIEATPLTISLTRADLDDITLGRSTFQEKLANGSITVKGAQEDFGNFLSIHDQPDPLFNVVTP